MKGVHRFDPRFSGTIKTAQVAISMDSQQQRHFNLAKASLQQAISWYGNTRRHWHYPPDLDLKAAVRPELTKLQQASQTRACY